ncbi:hypothetical protein RSOLAG1IB_06492 [Rhizoctonia solani AG-1 IB]|uniref:Uncharacterized protein n=2 Tax=Thanatephorus cucumeris (strain AG1-IB / isolate 7/3/14) TaxID=1108050 RepID=A0A0B7FBQ9_THACB|nr:hypothetical protein RSOLAG1IB_06492 [Rhizoctonia solani AG-1 IB]
MRFNFSSLLTIAAAATTVLAHPSKRAQELNPPPSVLKHTEWDKLTPASVETVTNAKRFAQGLPPLNPRRRNPNRSVHRAVAHARGTRVITAPRSETSPSVPISEKCNILVKKAGTEENLGFVSPEWNRFAEYGPLQGAQDGSLEVAMSYSSDSHKQLDLLTTNGKSAHHPFFGASSGYGSSDDDLKEDTPNYLILTGNTQTLPGSSPSYDAENSFSEETSIPVSSQSAIWEYDPTSKNFSAWWVNADGSSVKPRILWSNQGDTMFVLTQSPAMFRETFGVEAPEVTFTCVQPVVAPV